MQSTEHVVFNGSVLSPGVSEDYTLTGKIITLLRRDFEITDKITVFYNYDSTK